MRLFGLLLMLLCVSLSSAVCQTISSSPYTVYGLGFIHDRSSTLNRGMAGTGIAVRDNYFLNHANPASYNSISSPISHIFEMGFYIEGNRFETSASSESKSTGGLTNLNYWFKFSRRWASTIGLTPLSSVSYNITSQKELGALTSKYSYEGSGNITQVFWGNSISITKNLSVGANASFIFGSVLKKESIAPSAIQNGLQYENKISTNKFDLDAGLQYQIPIKKRTLVFGLVADNGITFNGTQDYLLLNESYDTLARGAGEKTSYKLPASIGAGLALQSKKSILAADLKFKQWSKAEYAREDLYFQDTWKVSLGYTYKGNPDAESYLGFAGLRTGFYYQDHYIKLKEKSFPNWGVALGISLPVLDNKSTINLTYTFDRIGSLEKGLVLQNSQKIMLDLVIRDFWGIRRKFD